MKHDDVAAAEAKMPQAVDHALGFVEQIGDEHHQPALPDAVREQVQRLRDVGAPAERQRSSVTRIDRRWPGRALAGSIAAIASSKVVSATASRCRFIRYARDAASIEPYRSLVSYRRCVSHRRADVQQQMAIEVRFLLELLDVIPSLRA